MTLQYTPKVGKQKRSKTHQQHLKNVRGMIFFLNYIYIIETHLCMSLYIYNLILVIFVSDKTSNKMVPIYASVFHCLKTNWTITNQELPTT